MRQLVTTKWDVYPIIENKNKKRLHLESIDRGLALGLALKLRGL